jgi:biopolymer transport protein ExbD
MKKQYCKSHLTILSGLILLLLCFSACSTIKLQTDQLTQKKSPLPRDMKFAEENSEVRKESACLITANDDTGNVLIGKEQISKDRLVEKITTQMEAKTPEKRIVYIEAAETIKYQTLVELFNSIRKADVDKVGLVVIKTDSEKPGARAATLEVKLPNEVNPNEIPKPNPLTLIVSVDKTKNMFLNKDSLENIDETSKLMKALSGVFKQREVNGVFREGTNEIEKNTTLKASLSLNYGDVAKVLNAMKGSGAQPITIQIDDLLD